MVETLVGGSNRAVTLALPECFLLPYFTHISYIINLYGLLQKAVIFNYIPRRKSGIYWIQVRRAAAVEISLWTR